MTNDEERTESERLTGWIERTVGGRVTRISKLARWRPAWDIDVEVDGTLLPLHARGEREAHFAIPWRIADERRIHELLESNGLPVPHAYGICPEPYALVMDSLAGHVDLTFAAGDEERATLVDAYLDLLPRIYGIDVAEAAAAGLDVPTDGRRTALGALERFEELHDTLMPERDPVAAFLRRWLHRNVPAERFVARFITYDAFQFMFEDGCITGLLDFELAHVGDPMMDLAALRVRDTIKNLGDLAAIADRFSQVTGLDVDHDVVDYHLVLYNTLTVLSAGPPIASPTRATDFVSHQAWYVNSARWAFETIAQIQDFTLTRVDPPEPHPSRHARAYAFVADGLRAVAADGDYEHLSLQRAARQLRRIDEVGRQLDEADLDGLADLLGHRPDDADTELLAFIDTAGPEHDAELARLLDRRVQRMHMLLAPEGSLMLRHPPLRSLRPGADDATASSSSWPAGSIPGTGDASTAPAGGRVPSSR